jgi:hypothetical protein
MPFDSTPPRPNEVDVGILEEARELIAGGWCQGRLYRREVRPSGDFDPAEYCIMGAIGTVAYGIHPRASDSREVSCRIVEKYLFPEIIEVWDSENDPRKIYRTCKTGAVEAFNDQKERTTEDVLTLFNRAIARAKMGE